jgi:protein O-GlcNAc transferase
MRLHAAFLTVLSVQLPLWNAAALEAAPQDAETLYRLGTRRLEERNPAAAIAPLKQCVELKPDDAAAWKALGIAHAEVGDYESSEPAFRKACELAPSLPDACVYHGRALYLLNRFQPALDLLRRVAKEQPENAQVHRLTAMSLEALGKNGEAEEEFRTALRLDRGSPPNSDPAIDYGVFLFRRGRAEEALTPLETAVKHHPDSARAHLELGCVLLALDRLSEAEPYLERSVALDPGSARAHLLLAKVYQRLGKTEAAAEQLRQGSRTAR